jgi:peptidoglycan/LPS O-acetylase OafA/YrhL
MVRYFWRRCLRIMPAFWLALLVTAFVFGPIAWLKEHGSIDGYWNAPSDSPLTYVWQNMFLGLDQRNIAGMGTSLPYADLGGYDWNGSAWTLQYEFKAYIMVGILGIVGYAASRWLSTVAAVVIIAFNALLWSGSIAPATWTNWLVSPDGHLHAFLSDPFNAMLLAPFAFGMLFALWGKYVPLHWGLALVALGAAVATYDLGGWNVWGQFGLLYFLMWAAIAWTKLQNWEKYGDFSYGIYIFGWPLMQFCSYFGLHDAGMLVYFAVIAVAAHVVGFCSWHLIEKPAMSLKDWSPAPLFSAAPWRRRQSATEAPSDPPQPVAPPAERPGPSDTPAAADEHDTYRGVLR